MWIVLSSSFVNPITQHVLFDPIPYSFMSPLAKAHRGDESNRPARSSSSSTVRQLASLRPDPMPTRVCHIFFARRHSSQKSSPLGSPCQKKLPSVLFCYLSLSLPYLSLIFFPLDAPGEGAGVSGARSQLRERERRRRRGGWGGGGATHTTLRCPQRCLRLWMGRVPARVCVCVCVLYGLTPTLLARLKILAEPRGEGFAAGAALAKTAQCALCTFLSSAGSSCYFGFYLCPN